ncbi:unnamed protein product [Notodromas monacha]|uniref:Uncharacterized protein n=1 Tax=Notodromas monacha TaxID=399045 RepID=A0A7R9C2K1_9CRUS|nr:unnamed protein product [Notodromas monacha]CAG0924971.1 unnamed protein product [Notodromas monacha]
MRRVKSRRAPNPSDNRQQPSLSSSSSSSSASTTTRNNKIGTESLSVAVGDGLDDLMSVSQDEAAPTPPRRRVSCRGTQTTINDAVLMTSTSQSGISNNSCSHNHHNDDDYEENRLMNHDDGARVLTETLNEKLDEIEALRMKLKDVEEALRCSVNFLVYT